jgi:adenylate kinase
MLGVSGVGKSTLLGKLAEVADFQHLQASALIRSAREDLEAREIVPDMLRHSNIDENQKLLMLGFERAVDSAAEIVILDGHSVIDTPQGLTPISPLVFGVLAVEQLIFLSENPSTIAQRRELDKSRNRPARSVLELEWHQDAALTNLLKICLHLRIPLTVLSDSDPHKLAAFISAGKSSDS